MKYNITYVSESDLFIVVTGGEMSCTGFVAMGREVLEHPEWVKDNNILFDHRSLVFESIRPDDIEEIRAFHRKNETEIGKGKSAIIVAQGSVPKWNYIWSQGDKILTDNRVKIFDSYVEAEDWVSGN